MNYTNTINQFKSFLDGLDQDVIDGVLDDKYDGATGYEVAGLVWFQGWNDLVDTQTYPESNKPGGFDAYTETLAHFIRDVRKEFSAPKMPFVIGVMGVGGPVESYTRKGPGARGPPFLYQSRDRSRFVISYRDQNNGIYLPKALIELIEEVYRDPNPKV